jgi:hypothetical protein
MMKNNEIKILRLIITIIVTLGILLGGYNLYQEYMVKKPLAEKLLQVEAVNKVDIKKVNNIYTVQTHLDQVENIQKIYTDLDAIINDGIKGNYLLEIKDKRNRKLDKFFDDFQPALHQGLAQKEFLWLAQQLEQQGQSQDIKARLLVDNKRIYLQLEDGNSYLYSIIEHTAGAEQETGGGRDN